MSKTLDNVKLVDLLPENLRDNPDIIAASVATDKEFKNMIINIQNCFTITGIKTAKEPVVDLLATEMNANFYNLNLPIETKRKLAETAYETHFTKGTPYAVEQLITLLFDEGRVEEWFEYGGVPGTFRVVTNNQSVTSERAEEFIQALNSVKNLRSWLDSVIISQKETMNLYFAGIVHTGDKHYIRQVV